MKDTVMYHYLPFSSPHVASSAGPLCESMLSMLGMLEPNSIEKVWLEFWLEKPLEFWLEIPYTKKLFKNG